MAKAAGTTTKFKVPKSTRDLNRLVDAGSHLQFGPDEVALWRDACLKSFWLYMLYAFGARAYCQTHQDQDWMASSTRKVVWRDFDIHRDYCEWYGYEIDEWMRLRRTERKDLQTSVLSLLSRNTAKSVIATCGAPSWVSIKDTELCIFLDSYKLPVTKDFLAVIQRLFEGQAPGTWFTPLFGYWNPNPGDRTRAWNETQAIHAFRRDLSRKDPSFECVSVETGLTSRHPDFVALDDPVVREKLNEEGEAWIIACRKHVKAIFPALQPNGFFGMTMTRYTDNDPAVEAMRSGVLKFAPTGVLPEPRDFNMTIKPNGWRVFFAPGLRADGEAMFEKVWSKRRIEDYAALDAAECASQVMLNVMTGADHPISKELLDKFTLPRDEFPRDLRISLHFDTAFKNPENTGRGDSSTIIVAGHSMNADGLVYFIASPHSNQWNEIDFADRLAILLEDLNMQWSWPQLQTDEANIGGKGHTFRTFLAQRFVSRGLPFLPPRHIDLNRSGKNKEVRKATFVSYVVAGSVRFLAGGEGLDLLKAQLMAFPQQWLGHDDLIDAGADAFKYPEVYRPGRLDRTQEARPKIMRPYDAQTLTAPREWHQGALQRAVSQLSRGGSNNPRLRHVMSPGLSTQPEEAPTWRRRR